MNIKNGKTVRTETKHQPQMHAHRFEDDGRYRMNTICLMITVERILCVSDATVYKSIARRIKTTGIEPKLSSSS